MFMQVAHLLNIAGMMLQRQRVNNNQRRLYNYTRSNEPLISVRIFWQPRVLQNGQKHKFGRQNDSPELNPTRICGDVHWLAFSHLIKVLVYWFIHSMWHNLVLFIGSIRQTNHVSTMWLILLYYANLWRKPFDQRRITMNHK